MLKPRSTFTLVTVVQSCCCYVAKREERDVENDRKCGTACVALDLASRSRTPCFAVFPEELFLQTDLVGL